MVKTSTKENNSEKNRKGDNKGKPKGEKGKGDNKRSMTVAEAGKKGGEAVKEKHGEEFYQEIGQKGRASRNNGAENKTKTGKNKEKEKVVKDNAVLQIAERSSQERIAKENEKPSNGNKPKSTNKKAEKTNTKIMNTKKTDQASDRKTKQAPSKTRKKKA